MLSRCRFLGRHGGAWVSDLPSGEQRRSPGGVHLRRSVRSSSQGAALSLASERLSPDLTSSHVGEGRRDTTRNRVRLTVNRRLTVNGPGGLGRWLGTPDRSAPVRSSLSGPRACRCFRTLGPSKPHQAVEGSHFYSQAKFESGLASSN